MRALLDQKDVVRLLRLEVNRAGSQKKWAKKNGVTQSLISMVLSGYRPLNNKIISALKLRRIVVCGEARSRRRLGQMSRTHSLPREPRAKKVGRPQKGKRAAKGSELDKGWCRHEQGLNDSESS